MSHYELMELSVVDRSQEEELFPFLHNDKEYYQFLVHAIESERKRFEVYPNEVQHENIFLLTEEANEIAAKHGFPLIEYSTSV